MQAFKLEQYFAEFEFTAKYLLSSSDCEPLGLSEVLQMADNKSLNLWDSLKLAYTESLGLPLLRKEIAKQYSGISAEQIIVLGPQEGIFLAMNTLLNSGDEVVVTFPGYQSLYEVAIDKKCSVEFWKPNADHQFNLDDLEQLLSHKTKLLVINFPHNPTGALISKNDFEKIVALCREMNIILFSDEMYRNLEYQQEHRLPSVAETYENSLTLCGMSKSYALPGLRLGWLVVHDPELLKAIQEMKDYTTICPPAPSEILALIALRNRQAIFDRNLSIIQKNISLMEEFTNNFSDIIRWIPPVAGSIAFPELLLDKDIEKFCRCLVEKTGVMLLPGSVYDYPGRYFRVGLGRKEMDRGLKMFREFLM